MFFVVSMGGVFFGFVCCFVIFNFLVLIVVCLIWARPVGRVHLRCFVFILFCVFVMEFWCVFFVGLLVLCREVGRCEKIWVLFAICCLMRV